jgi:AraC-like DNA-binding protein
MRRGALNAHPIVVALIVGTKCRARVRGALAGRATVLFCERRSDLLRVAAAARASAVIAEPRDQLGDDVSAAIEAVRAGLPSVPVIAYIADGRATSGDILAMARAGVHDLVRTGFDDVGFALGAALASATATCATATARDELESLVTADAWPFVSYCLTRAQTPISIRTAAEALGLDRRTLVRRLERSRLPPPRRIAGWCRVIAAARLLDEPVYTLEQAALRLDFPSGTALRNMLLRYTGLRPREIRENGGVRCVLHLFKRELAGTRASASVHPPAA